MDRTCAASRRRKQARPQRAQSILDPQEQRMSNEQKQQDRPVAIVTGPSGGIGKATARAVARAGYRLRQLLQNAAVEGHGCRVSDLGRDEQ